MRHVTPEEPAKSDTGAIREQLQLPPPPLFIPRDQTDDAGPGCPVPDPPPFEEQLPALRAHSVVKLVKGT